jgi:hypothetical protein
MNMNYKQVFHLESINNYGVKMSIALDRDFTEDDNMDIHKSISDLMEKILYRTQELDPKIKEINIKTRQEFVSLFTNSIYVEEIPNEYHKSPLSWFKITTKIGHIKIGWRKRVIYIDWTNTEVLKSGEELFPDEDVTRSSKYDNTKYIHAWSYEKAKEYINKLILQE